MLHQQEAHELTTSRVEGQKPLDAGHNALPLPSEQKSSMKSTLAFVIAEETLWLTSEDCA